MIVGKSLYWLACSRLNERQLRYCVLREPADWATPRVEVDLLVDPDDLGGLRRAVSSLGFVEVPAWGRNPHHFFVAFDVNSRTWLKLDVVTEIAFGAPSHALRTSLGRACLMRRRHEAGISRPRAEDELVALAMHAVVDKRNFTAERQDRLAELCRQVTDVAYLDSLLYEWWPGMIAKELARLVEGGAWQELLDQRAVVERHLLRRSPIATTLRRLRDPLLRKLERVWSLLRPRTLTVAILAPDGAGKSTLIAALDNSFHCSVHAVYMGLYGGKAKAFESRVPGKALLSRLLTQWRRYFDARLHQARGRFVFFDRYSYDALLPSIVPKRGARLRRWLLAGACPAPDLVVLLDAPGKVLFERKGEHTAAALEHQRAGYLSLQSRLPQMVVVDATRDAAEVCRDVTSLVWNKYADRLRPGSVA